MDSSKEIMKEGLSCMKEYIRKEEGKHKNVPSSNG